MHTTTVTPRLGLMKPEGSDSFERQDFIDTFTILDGSPGSLVCSSTTRPTGWGAAQAGRLAVETDTGRVIRWDGTSWTFVYNYPFIGTISVNPSASLNKNATATYTLGVGSMSRSCKYVAIGHAWIGQQNGDIQTAKVTLLFDGTDMSSFGPDDLVKMGGNAQGNDRSAVPLIGTRNCPAGTHTISVRVEVGNLSNSPITFYGAKISTFLAEQT